MSKWDERNVIKDDFNKAAIGQTDKEPEKPKDPEMKPKPPSFDGPGGMGSGSSNAWDRQQQQTLSQGKDKGGTPPPSGLKQEFNSAARKK